MVGEFDRGRMLVSKSLINFRTFQQQSKDKQQHVFDSDTAICSAEDPLRYKRESIQSEKVMAAGIREDLPEASIQTRTQIQEESEAKVGSTEMDKGC